MKVYYVSVTVHVLAAILWLGGMFFLGLVAAPLLRAVEPPSLRAELFRRIGQRFRTVGWVAITVMIVTGMLNLHFRGLLSWTVLPDSGFWNISYGRALVGKLATVIVMLVLSAVHDFVLGPAASRVTADSPEARKLTLWSAWLARHNALVGVVLVVLAVRLARGG